MKAQANTEVSSGKQNPYLNSSYDTKRRFCGYWHQIDEIISLKPENILEIGVGSGFVASYLKNKNHNVVSFDILEELNPDAVGSVVHLPFGNKSFSVVSCCEVLEHLPYSEFSQALCEIHRVSQKHVVLSLPDDSAIYKFDIQFSKLMMIKKLFSDPFHKPNVHKFDGHHYWEIGKVNFPLEKILHKISMAQFKVINTYQVIERPFQRFFVLKTIHG